jgi:hypothetical protein
MRTLLLSATALGLLSACSPVTTSVTATEMALCDAWQDTLLLPSRFDTEVSARAMNRQIDVFEAACQRTVD